VLAVVVVVVSLLVLLGQAVELVALQLLTLAGLVRFLLLAVRVGLLLLVVGVHLTRAKLQGMVVVGRVALREVLVVLQVTVAQWWFLI
jgi:hypothetical protein